MSPRMLLIAAALTALTTAAGEVRQLSLEDCLQLAIEKNLGLRIARYDPRLAAVSLHAAYAPYDPTFDSTVGQSFRTSPKPPVVNPTVFTPTTSSEIWDDQYSLSLAGLAPSGLTYSLTAGLDRNGVTSTQHLLTNNLTTSYPLSYNDSVSLSLRQPLLKDFWIDGTRLNISLAKNTLKQTQESYRGSLLDLCLSVTKSYYDLIATQDGIRVQTAALELSERSLAENHKKVEVGAMAPLEEKQAEAQVASRRADLIVARERYDRAVNIIKNLTSDDFSSLDGSGIRPAGALEAIPEVFNRQDSWHKALTLRPDILQEKLTLESWHVSLKYDRNQLFPQLDLTGGYGLVGNQLHLDPVLGDIGDRANPKFSYGIEFKVPLSNRQAKDRIKRDRLQLERELLFYKRLEQNAMKEVDDDILGAQSALERVAATKAAQIYAVAALDAEQKKLENGKSTSFNVLQLQRDLVTAESTAIQALTDYNKALVDLARAEGTLLDRLKISVTMQ